MSTFPPCRYTLLGNTFSKNEKKKTKNQSCSQAESVFMPQSDEKKQSLRFVCLYGVVFVFFMLEIYLKWKVRLPQTNLTCSGTFNQRCTLWPLCNVVFIKVCWNTNLLCLTIHVVFILVVLGCSDRNSWDCCSSGSPSKKIRSPFYHVSDPPHFIIFRFPVLYFDVLFLSFPYNPLVYLW